MTAAFWWGVLVGAMAGGSLTFILACVIINGREDRFWRRMGAKK